MVNFMLSLQTIHRIISNPKDILLPPEELLANAAEQPYFMEARSGKTKFQNTAAGQYIYLVYTHTVTSQERAISLVPKF